MNEEVLNFIKKNLPKIVLKYKLEEWEYKDPQIYLDILSKNTVYKITQEQIDDFIEAGYEDYVADLTPGEWVLDDDEVCYSINVVDKWKDEIESNYKEGYQLDIQTLLCINYTYEFIEKEESDG
jgi:hypothetical protein